MALITSGPHNMDDLPRRWPNHPGLWQNAIPRPSPQHGLSSSNMALNTSGLSMRYPAHQTALTTSGSCAPSIVGMLYLHTQDPPIAHLDLKVAPYSCNLDGESLLQL